MCYSHYGNEVCNGAIFIGQYPKSEHVNAYGTQIVVVVVFPQAPFRVTNVSGHASAAII